MRVLVTSARMPVALEEIRKLGRAGHTVIATDTFRTAPGLHSRHVTRSYRTASPRHATARFIDDIRGIVETEDIDLVVPAFEEAIHLAWHADIFAPLTELFLPPFETLTRLHHKGQLMDLAQRLGLRVPRSVVARTAGELRDAVHVFSRYVARPVYSRGGAKVLANAGPLVGGAGIERLNPTSGNPWIVQEFIDGADVCSFSMAQGGAIVAHSAYVHPREIEHAGGIVFESIDEPETLRVARVIAAATAYRGQLSLDFRRTLSGLVLIECNPRPTPGVLALSTPAFVDALFDRRPRCTRMGTVGLRHKYSVALIRDMLLHRADALEDMAHLVSSAKDVYADLDDPLPALYQMLSYTHVLAYRRRKHPGEPTRSILLDAYFDDICWDGESLGRPLPEQGQDTRMSP